MTTTEPTASWAERVNPRNWTLAWKLVAIGLVLGTGVALLLSRLASALLYGVSASDPATYLVIALTLAAIALVAIVLPARRAMEVDPMEALRKD